VEKNMIIHCTIRKSKPKKLTKEQQREFDAFCKRHGLDSLGKPTQLRPSSNKRPSLEVPSYRKSSEIPSLDTWSGVGTTKKQANVYTGDKMLGIGTLHKSNAVPVFSQEDAQDMAKMRRG
jgi:hypothetical protein